MRMEELKAAPHANGEVKVLNLTTGKVTSFTPGKGGSIAFEGNAKRRLFGQFFHLIQTVEPQTFTACAITTTGTSQRALHC